MEDIVILRGYFKFLPCPYPRDYLQREERGALCVSTFACICVWTLVSVNTHKHSWPAISLSSYYTVSLQLEV